MTATAIAGHAFVSDCHSAALITGEGTVDWLCLPRFDSPAVFAALLDDTAGHWSIRPTGQFTSTRRYVGRTLVLETTFHAATGTVVLTDALAMGPDNRGHALGARAPHLLMRSATCVRGEVDLHVEYQPRPEFGIIAPLLSVRDGGVTARGGAEWLVLSTAVPMAVAGSDATARVPLHTGQTVRFALHRSTLEEEPARIWSQQEIAARLDSTLAAWESWSQLHQNYQGPWRDLVHHSGRVLQGLTFQPSGAIVAAVTTSLPEAAGRERNWDYRYSWARDASFTMQALWVAACPDEASDFFAFMTTAAAGGIGAGHPLQIMFGVGGEHDLTERTLPHLRGWHDSRPVRAGNDAWTQQQIDVYGELLAAADLLADEITAMDDDMRAFLVALADTAAARWREPDHGIWEIRGEPRHFLYSKVMCWVALDRAVRLADRLCAEDRVEGWRATRDEIRQTVVREGWNPAIGAFTQSFGSDTLDAANLMMPIVGFLPADDPRVLATIDAVADRLTDDRGLVYRYRGGDGLPGAEGAFLLCTFWLAQALALAGDVVRATEVFERAAAFVNDVGLLAEEVDSRSGALLGNFPQAFSHIGLINAAWAISQT
jgi:GH15 family glucan-1,4-alpha-glucosidase